MFAMACSEEKARNGHKNLAKVGKLAGFREFFGLSAEVCWSVPQK
ncbi:hypothetical protein [Microbulbifer halophilus]